MDKQLSEWLFYAESDLKSAVIILNSEEEVYHISVFHSHQCVEKVFKAFLIFKQHQDLPRIHNLLKLLAIATKYQKDLESYKDSIMDLDRYYPKVRYPYGDLLAKEDAQICYSIAKKTFEYIHQLILDK